MESWVKAMDLYIRWFLLLLSPVWSLSQDINFDKLALWIDGKEMEPLIGTPVDIFVIRDGVVVPYIQQFNDPRFQGDMPVLPPQVESVQLTWTAPNNTYYYEFTRLISLDPVSLYDPLLSIPAKGIIPHKKTVFHIAIPCTGKRTTTAFLHIILHIRNYKDRPIEGSPLSLSIRKRCLIVDSHRLCKGGCKHGGTCNTNGRCDCPKGYSGQNCEQAACFPVCENNATCILPGVCDCQPSYTGDRCQKALCRWPCLHGGACAQPEVCECPSGHYGNYCQFKEGNCKMPCKNGGTCAINGRCACPYGYRGRYCQKPTCAKSCRGHGRCTDIDTCTCNEGWKGRHCNKAVNETEAQNNNVTSSRRKRKKKSEGNPRKITRDVEGKRRSNKRIYV